MQQFDAVVIGAGAAGLFAAGMAGQLGLRVLLVDHADKVAEKVRISGGGRCNFTNRDTTPDNFISDNPRFCRSALARYTPADFIALLGRHRIEWHEKHKGQLFCNESSEDIVRMLLRECEAGGVVRRQPCAVSEVRRAGSGFEVDTDQGVVSTPRLVVATGGLSIPKIGASDFGLRLARQFDHSIVPTRAALVPLTFDGGQWARFAALAGLSLPARIETGDGKQRGRFVEDLLFTHRGLSGPGILQISSYWAPGDEIRLDLAPSHDLAATLRTSKSTSRRKLANELATLIPARLADAWLAGQPDIAERTMPEQRDRDLAAVAGSLSSWAIRPAGSEGYRKAEVMAGGVDTRELSSQTLESRKTPGLYFIGEVVDMTGWLGGYNFQWAWASGAACARGMAAAR